MTASRSHRNQFVKTVEFESPFGIEDSAIESRMRHKLERLFPNIEDSTKHSSEEHRHSEAILTALWQRIAQFRKTHEERTHAGDLACNPRAPRRPLCEQDALLIAYGDHIVPSTEDAGRPLQALHRFASDNLLGVFSGIHLLPHFPYSSDDGFSVIDYLKVDPALGTWLDVESLAHDFDMMFDAVINHISSKSAWFAAYKQGEPPYNDFFIEADPAHDFSEVYRPRAKPLLTQVETTRGPRHVWTTFSEDQIDLNYQNPELLLRIVDVLLAYATHGARYLRLDAIGFLWKRPGTRCFHLEETHLLVQLLRDIFDATCPEMVLVPEINGPHDENLPYLADGQKEAQLVYNFALPPLILHSFGSGDAGALSDFIENIALPEGNVALFNFIACHDGLGVRAASPLLSAEAFAAMVSRAEANGALIGYRTGEDGKPTPYELNGTLWTLLNGRDSNELGLARMRGAHALALALPGVPGIYFHSLFGTESWQEGYAQTQQPRTLNRYKWPSSELDTRLSDNASRETRMLGIIKHLLRTRAERPVFHPSAPHHVHRLHPNIVAVERRSIDGMSRLLALHNLTNTPVTIEAAKLPTEWASLHTLNDLLAPATAEAKAYSPGKISRDSQGNFSLEPLAAHWLTH